MEKMSCVDIRNKFIVVMERAKQAQLVVGCNHLVRVRQAKSARSHVSKAVSAMANKGNHYGLRGRHGPSNNSSSMGGVGQSN